MPERTIQRVKPQRARWCRCGGQAKQHWEEATDLGVVLRYGRGPCREHCNKCQRFRPGKSPARATRKSIKDFARQAETRVAKLLGGERIGNSGRKNADVRVKKLGELVAIVECKQGPWRAVFNAYDQVRDVPSAGSPRRLVAFVEKPGPGKPSRVLICEEVDEWLGWNGKGDVQ